MCWGGGGGGGISMIEFHKSAVLNLGLLCISSIEI